MVATLNKATEVKRTNCVCKCTDPFWIDDHNESVFIVHGHTFGHLNRKFGMDKLFIKLNQHIQGKSLKQKKHIRQILMHRDAFFITSGTRNG